METLNTEVLVIGSGFGAAAPALRLSQAGLQVMMIEKGKDIVPERDFKQTQDPKYLLQYLKSASSNQIGFTYAEALGGGSGFYEMVSLRTPTKAFEQYDENGRRFWPAGLDRQVMDPFYDIAEQMLNVEQIAVDEIPKSGVAFSALMKNLGYSCDRARYAVKGCFGSGFCITGCLFGAKQSLHLNYLPQAKELGMQIMTEIEAVDIQKISSGGRSSSVGTIDSVPVRYRVRCRRSKDGSEFVINAKLVILGGGTVGTARLLLNSRENLPMLSQHVGKNIAFNGSVKAVGLLPDGFIEGDMLSGRSHPGMISYQFLDSLGVTISSAKPLPIEVMASAHLTVAGEAGSTFWGEKHVELMKLYRRKMIVLYALGLTPPSAEIRQTGVEEFEPHLEITPQLRSYYNRTRSLLHSIFTRNGGRVLDAKMIDGEGNEREDIQFSTAHMVGACRMADTKANGVVDGFGEVFDYPGLYVTDGAAVPTSLAVNSSLTILANAERIAAHLARKFRKSTRREAAVASKS